MNALLALLTFAAVAAGAPTDDVYPIEIRPEHGAISWIVLLTDESPNCTVYARIGRMGDQPLGTVFRVELDASVNPEAEGSTPLTSLAPGTYDLHLEGACFLFAYSLVPR
jgi:hypothetical protein